MTEKKDKGRFADFVDNPKAGALKALTSITSTHAEQPKSGKVIMAKQKPPPKPKR